MSEKVSEEEIDAFIEYSKKHAKEKGWILNPNQEKVRNVVRLTLLNKKKKGVRYCPCKPSMEGVQREIDGEMVYVSECPCPDAPKEVEEDGKCCCNLYWAQEDISNWKQAGSSYTLL